MAVKHKSVGIDLQRAEWEAVDAHELDGKLLSDVIVTSIPVSGMCRILNIYYNPQNHKVIVEYDDEPMP